jgi:hypothetical protein
MWTLAELKARATAEVDEGLTEVFGNVGTLAKELLLTVLGVKHDGWGRYEVLPYSHLNAILKEKAAVAARLLLEEPYTLTVKEQQSIRKAARDTYLDTLERLVEEKAREKAVAAADSIAQTLLEELIVKEEQDDT